MSMVLAHCNDKLCTKQRYKHNLDRSANEMFSHEISWINVDVYPYKKLAGVQPDVIKA